MNITVIVTIKKCKRNCRSVLKKTEDVLVFTS